MDFEVFITFHNNLSLHSFLMAYHVSYIIYIQLDVCCIMVFI